VALATARHRGFVNAVLRRLSSSPPEPPTGDDDHAISLRTGLAEWAVEELHRLLPEHEVERAAGALAAPAPLSVRVNRCRTEPDRLETALRGAGLDPQRGRFHPDVLRVPGGRVADLPGFAEGWFAVQDEASVLVTAAAEAKPGERVLDACAGPGGKAAHLACLVQPGGTVAAADVHPVRAGLVARSAQRLGVPILVVALDARRPALREGFDVVLVDAPCSGVGAARRRPELLWRPSRSDLARLARLQVAILAGVADLVRPDGRLVYSVCTFPRAETEAAVRAFLAKRPDFAPADVPGPDGPAPTHRLWPHRHGTDAMFIAGFRRTAPDGGPNRPLT
jgi:16S rRNA (cytosine967-C5)-methyltransferase